MSNTDKLASPAISPFMKNEPVPDKPPPAPQQQWTLWEETNSIVANLLGIEKHCQQLRADIDIGIRTLERMIGQQVKR